MADRDQMIAELKRRDMINQLKARDAAKAEGDATVAAEKKYEETKPGVIESGVLGAYQGLTRNFGDELVGKIGGLIGNDAEATKANVQERIKRSKDDQPLAYSAGEVGSKIATLPVTANPLGAAAIAGIDTAVSTVGDAEDKLSLDTAKKAATRGSIDAVTAGILTKAMPGLSSKIGEYGDDASRWLSGILQKRADTQTIKALGATQGQTQKLGAKLPDVAKMVRDEKIITPFSSSKQIAENADNLGEKLAAQTKPIYAQTVSSRMPQEELLSNIDSKIAELKPNPGNDPIIRKLEAYKESIYNSNPSSLNPSELRDFRRSVDKTINFNSDAPSQIASKDMRNIIREAEMGQIEKIDPALRAQNEGLFRNIHLNSLVEDMADKGAARSAANNDIGLNTWQAMNVAADVAGGSGLATALTGALREGARRFGPQMQAIGLDKLAVKLAGSQFEPMFIKAAERGPQAVIALHQALRSNPDFQKLVGRE